MRVCSGSGLPRVGEKTGLALADFAHLLHRAKLLDLRVDRNHIVKVRCRPSPLQVGLGS
jgi:hypothetical protein